MLSPKANRWTYSQWNWVHLCNSWANLHCHLSLLKITWSSRVYRAHSTAQLFGKRLWNPQLGHQRTNKHTMEFLFVRPLLHAPPKSISLCSCWDNNWLLILLPRRRLRKVIIPGQAAPVLWNENLFGWFTREGKKATRKNKQTELKQSKTKQKRLFRKVARCCHATLVQTQQNDFRTSVWLLGLSSQSFISYSFGGIIHGKLRTVS